MVMQGNYRNYKETGYFTKKGLKKSGWTNEAINDFLGKPDGFFPHSRHKQRTHRYNYDRVMLTEESEVFKEWQKKNKYTPIDDIGM